MTKVSRFLSKRPETVKELLEKAADHLVKIGVCFGTNLEDLPAEVRRDRNCFHSDKELFSLLDRHLQHNTLDAFLHRHKQCRELVAFVFGGRYPRLIPDPAVRQALAAADGTSSVDGQKLLSKKRPRQRQQDDEDGTSWKAKKIRTEDGGDGGGGFCLPPTEQERCALLAFEEFQTADDDPLMPPSARGQFLTRAELEALETKINGAHSNTHLTFTLPPRSPSPAPDQSLASDIVPHDHTADSSEKYCMSAIQASLAAENGVDEGRLMEYKGHLLEPPSSLLAKLKSHLSKPDVEQSPHWARCSADIQEYLAYLLQIRAGESWEPQLDEVVDMFRAHTLFDDFHRDHPGLDHSLWDDVMKPRHTLHNPLAPPAQLQGAAAQSVVLGTKRKAEEEEEEEEEEDDDFYGKDPITFNSMMLAEVPLKDSRDPFAYTRWHNCLRANMEEAADEAREVAMERMENPKTEHAGFPVMNVPQNCTGPVSASLLLDLVACKMSSDWTTLRHLRTSLQRAARRSPRLLLEEVNTSVELGMAFKKSDAAAAQDSDGVSSPIVNSRFVRLQKEELDWLSFLGQPSLNYMSAACEMEALCRDDWKLAMLRKRLQKMQCSIAPGSFGDGHRFDLRGFLALVNQDCDGPVKGHRFTMEELKSRIPQLTQLKVLHTEQVDGAQHVRCFPGDVHPEEAVRWPASDGLRRRFRIQQSRDEDEDDYDMSPTTAPVPRSMPNMDHVRTVEECLVEQDLIRGDAARTVIFFRRIAYRLGRTLQEVAAESRYHLWLAGDPASQAANASSLRTLMARWAADTSRSAIPPCRDGRVVASYRDVVLAAEPEALAGRGGSDSEVETYCRDLVRRRILREAAENKTLLWPLPVPRDSSRVEGGEDGRTVLRREAVWSFAHPSRRESAPRYFDVNTWPLEVQSAETQAAIRARRGEDADAMLLD